MISSGSGGFRRRRNQTHLTDAEKATRPCPSLQRKGKCALHNQEQQLRRILVEQKQEERAKKLLLVKERLNIAWDDETVDEDELLKNEPEGQEWNLDVMVAERMFKRCKYNHSGVAIKKAKVVTTIDEETGEKIKTLVKGRVSALNSMQQLLYNLLSSREFTAKRKDLLTKEERESEDGTMELYTEAQMEEDVKHVLWNGAGAFDLSRLPRILVFICCPDNAGKWKCGHSDQDHTDQVANVAQNVVQVEQQVDLTTPQLCDYMCGAIESCLDCAADDTDNESESDDDEAESGDKKEVDEDEDDEEEENNEKKKATQLQLLRLQRCNIINADNLLAILKRRHLNENIRVLDLSFNKLDSMRFLFALKSYFPKLLGLSLFKNPITRKPDYREQVRRTLPKLSVLDGESVRKPPLNLPYPILSHGNPATEQEGGLTEELYEQVTTFLGRFFTVWENKVYNGLDLMEDHSDFAADFLSPNCTLSFTVDPECIWFDENKHVSTMDVTTQERRVLQKTASNVHNESERKTNETKGFEQLEDPNVAAKKKERQLRRLRAIQNVLTPVELKHLRIMHVAIHNNHRNLLAGKAAMHRVVRGPLLVMRSYMSSIYPQEHFIVEHHTNSCFVEMEWMTDIAQLDVEEEREEKDNNATNDEKKTLGEKRKRGQAPPPEPAPQQKEVGPERPIQLMAPFKRRPKKGQPYQKVEATYAPKKHTAATFGVVSYKPDYLLVTVHGVMSWRTPNMVGSQSIKMAVDRTFTLVPYVAPPDMNRGKYKRRNAKKQKKDDEEDDSDELGSDEDDFRYGLEEKPVFQIHNDQIAIRPFRGQETAGGVLFQPKTQQRVERFASYYGMEPNDPLVVAAMERSNSDAALCSMLDEATSILAGNLNDEKPQPADVEEEGSAKPVAEEEEEPPKLTRSGTSFKISSNFISEGHVGSATAVDAGSSGPEITAEDLNESLKRHNTATTKQFEGAQAETAEKYFATLKELPSALAPKPKEEDNGKKKGKKGKKGKKEEKKKVKGGRELEAMCF